MATQFQHRLVGTIILVALGVIFLPDLLDGKQPPMPEEAVSIPLRPELEPPRPVVPDAVDNAQAEVWTLEQVQEAPPQPPQAEVVSAPAVVTPEPIPKATPARPVVEVPATVVAGDADYIVQLGAFRNADNVNALVKKLQAAGYPAQTTPAVPREGELNRVWIGPDSKARLEPLLAPLERLTGLKGRVMTR